MKAESRKLNHPVNLQGSDIKHSLIHPSVEMHFISCLHSFVQFWLREDFWLIQDFWNTYLDLHNIVYIIYHVIHSHHNLVHHFVHGDMAKSTIFSKPKSMLFDLLV